MAITFSNRGWAGYKHNQTNKAKAKRKSKRNRAWKAIHKAAKRSEQMQGKSLLIRKIAEDNDIPVIEIKKADTVPSFLAGIKFGKG